MKLKNSLQKKIFVLSLLLVLIPLALFSVVNIVVSTRSAERNHKSGLTFNMKNIGSVVDSMFNDIERASLFIIGDKNIKDYLLSSTEERRAYIEREGMGTLYNKLIFLKNTSASIHSIQILGMDGHVLTHGPMPMGISGEDEARALALGGRAFWAVDENQGLGNSTVKHIYLCRLLRDPLEPSTHVGILKIYMDNAALTDFFKSELGQDTGYFIADTEGDVQFEAAPESMKETEILLPDYTSLRQNNSGVFRHDGYYVAPRRIAENAWVVYSLSQPLELHAQIRTSVVLLVVLAALCFVFCLALAYTISRSLTRPLHTVVTHMRLFEQDFATRAPVEGSDESAVLARQFNAMAEHIQTLVNKVYLANLRRKELELGALQAQVNPHFLYNTLDVVYWTAKMENAPETGEMVNSLSNFFRHALTDTGEYTTVENEIEHLRYYVVLRQQSKKFFDFSLEAEEDVLDCRVVKLVLQPLVENAILHGLREKEDGRIAVRIFRQGDSLVFTVSDNGPGLDVQDVRMLLVKTQANHRGFGLKNINDRIQLAYGEEYGLQFGNSPDGGAIITVRQPFGKEAQHD